MQESKTEIQLNAKPSCWVLSQLALCYPANGSSRHHELHHLLELPVSVAETREIDDPAKREELLQAMAHGSAAAWGHLNLLGEYDFSEDKLQDSVGIKPPKLTD